MFGKATGSSRGICSAPISTAIPLCSAFSAGQPHLIPGVTVLCLADFLDDFALTRANFARVPSPRAQPTGEPQTTDLGGINGRMKVLQAERNAQGQLDFDSATRNRVRAVLERLD